jgi:hypothetical protein
MRTVKTTSGATAVRVVWSSRRESRQIEHLGSAHDEQEFEALKALAQLRIAAGQMELDWRTLDQPTPSLVSLATQHVSPSKVMRSSWTVCQFGGM